MMLALVVNTTARAQPHSGGALERLHITAVGCRERLQFEIDLARVVAVNLRHSAAADVNSISFTRFIA
jgi:hypothetical protein